jgi:hypothetical protein
MLRSVSRAVGGDPCQLRICVAGSFTGSNGNEVNERCCSMSYEFVQARAWNAEEMRIEGDEELHDRVCYGGDGRGGRIAGAG